MTDQRALNYEALEGKDPYPLLKYQGVLVAFREMEPELYRALYNDYNENNDKHKRMYTHTLSTFIKGKKPVLFERARKMWEEDKKRLQDWYKRYPEIPRYPGFHFEKERMNKHIEEIGAFKEKLQDPGPGGDVARKFFCHFADQETMEEVRKSIENAKMFESMNQLVINNE